MKQIEKLKKYSSQYSENDEILTCIIYCVIRICTYIVIVMVFQ